MIRVVLFDLGGVVFRDIFSGGSSDFARALGLPEKEVLEAYAVTDVPAWPEGKISDEERWTLFVDRLGLSRSMVNVCIEQFNLVFRPIPETIRLLHELSAMSRYRLGVLSDQHRGADMYLRNMYGDVFKFFDPSLIFISAEIGLAKHDPQGQFFSYASSHVGVAAGELLFVDDSKSNIAQASGIGMQTFHFDTMGRSLASLTSDLSQLLTNQL